MEFKDTSKKLSLFDEVEEKSISFDECSFDGNHFMGLSIDNTDEVYIDPTQAKDVIEKLSRWVQKVESSQK